jgi:hypothetical protein
MFVAKLQRDRFGFCNRKYLNESGVKKLEMVGIIFEVSGGFWRKVMGSFDRFGAWMAQHHHPD